MNQIKKAKYRLLLFLPFLFLVIFFELVPLISMLTKSVQGNGGLTLDNFTQIFSKPIYISAITNSLGVAVIATIVGLIVDFLLAMALSQSKGTGKTLYLSVLNLTSTFSGLPMTLSFITILGTSGVFVLMGKMLGMDWLANYNLYSMKGMTVVYLYFQIPMGTLLLVPAFAKVQKEWKEAATLMNAGGVTFWMKVGVPVLMPAIMGTFNMLFANALTTYATPYLLINNSIALLPIKIVDMFVGDVRQRPELGSALSVVLLAIMLFILGLSNLIKRHYEKGQKG